MCVIVSVCYYTFGDIVYHLICYNDSDKLPAVFSSDFLVKNLVNKNLWQH